MTRLFGDKVSSDELELYTAVSAGTTAVTAAMHYISANTAGGTVTLNLPATDASDILAGKEYIIKKLGSNTLTINPNGSNLIEGVSSYGGSMVGGDSVTIKSDGGAGAAGNWEIVSAYGLG